jgi:hypothetical protein
VALQKKHGSPIEKNSQKGWNFLDLQLVYCDETSHKQGITFAALRQTRIAASCD